MLAEDLTNIFCEKSFSETNINNIKQLQRKFANIEMKIKVLKEVIQKYVEYIMYEDNFVARDVYRSIFRNIIFSLNKNKQDTANTLFLKKLKNELQYIEIVSDWLKSMSIKDIISSLSDESQSKIVFNITKILSKKDNDEIQNSSELKNKILRRSIIDELSFTSVDKDILQKCVDQFLNEKVFATTNTPSTQSTANNVYIKKYGEYPNLSEVIEEYIYLRGKIVIKDKLQLNTLTHIILSEMDIDENKTPHVVPLLTNELRNAKEICRWLYNLPLLCANDKNEYSKTIHIVSDFTEKIQIYCFFSPALQSENNKDFDDCLKKFILALPLNPNKEIDLQVAVTQLKNRLICVCQSSARPKSPQKISEHYLYEKNTRALQNKIPSTLPSCDMKITSNPAAHILKAVEDWCNTLPLPENTSKEREDGKIIREYLKLKIIMKISELNLNAETFNDDSMYDYLLHDELDNILSTLPTCFESTDSKVRKINNLKNSIKHIKNLIKEEKERYKYKQDLKKTFTDCFKIAGNINHVENAELLNTLRDDVVDNFIEYSYYENSKEKKRCKDRIRNQISKYLDHAQDKQNSTLKKIYKKFHKESIPEVDKILSELSKIQPPRKCLLKEDLKEIHLKKDLTLLFDDLNVPKHNLASQNQLKNVLAKRLNEQLNQGENILLIKKEIIKSLKKVCDKIDTDCDVTKIDAFVEKLKDAEIFKSNFVTRENMENVNKYKNEEQGTNSRYQSHLPYTSDKSRFEVEKNKSNKTQNSDNNWFSLPPATLLDKDILEDTHNDFNQKPIAQNICPSSIPSAGELNYKTFKKGIEFKSSIMEVTPNAAMQINHQESPKISTKNKNHDYQQKTDHDISLQYDIDYSDVEKELNHMEYINIPNANEIDCSDSQNITKNRPQTTHGNCISELNVHTTSTPPTQNELYYKDFEKGINFRSSGIEIAAKERSGDNQTKLNDSEYINMLKANKTYKDFERGINFRSSSIEIAAKKRSGDNQSKLNDSEYINMLKANKTYKDFEKGINFRSSSIEIAAKQRTGDNRSKLNNSEYRNVLQDNKTKNSNNKCSTCEDAHKTQQEIPNFHDPLVSTTIPSNAVEESSKQYTRSRKHELPERTQCNKTLEINIPNKLKQSFQTSRDNNAYHNISTESKKRCCNPASTMISLKGQYLGPKDCAHNENQHTKLSLNKNNECENEYVDRCSRNFRMLRQCHDKYCFIRQYNTCCKTMTGQDRKCTCLHRH